MIVDNLRKKWLNQDHYEDYDSFLEDEIRSLSAERDEYEKTAEKKSLLCEHLKSDISQLKAKKRALMVALEMENVDKFIDTYGVEEYTELGKIFTMTVKSQIDRLKADKTELATWLLELHRLLLLVDHSYDESEMGEETEELLAKHEVK